MKAFCLINHELTENQILELENEYNCDRIIYPSEDLSRQWSQIPAEKKIDMKIINAVTEWLNYAEKNDVLIVQGEFGSTFMLVDFALKKGLVPVHAVTKRVATEQRNGEIVTRQYVFQHVCFRRYEYYEADRNLW